MLWRDYFHFCLLLACIGCPVSDAGASLLLHYPVSTGTGDTLFDNSGFNRDASLEGASWTTDRFGNEGAALQTGKNAWANPPDAPLKPVEMTVAAWIYTDSAGSSPSPIWSAEKGQGASGFHSRLQITPDGKLRFEAVAPHGSSGYRSTTSSEALALETWHHVAGTYDGTTTRIFLDGVSIASDNHGSYQGLNTDGTIPVGLGHLENWSVQWFSGKIDDVYLYDMALEESAIASLAAIPEASHATWLFALTIFWLFRFRRGAKIQT